MFKRNKFIQYDSLRNTIMLGKGASATLPSIRQALNGKDVLEELRPGEWLLNANLRLEQGAALLIGGSAVQQLKLRSDAQTFVWIKVFGAKLTIEDTCVMSWDLERQAVDENYEDGRSFILARDGARMDIRRSELSYLGYDAYESYGVAWRLAGTSGEVIDSRLGYNYYGMYSNSASHLVIRGNEVYNSVRYGIDPHTCSNYLTIENNRAHHNGKHGIILAEACSNSIIRNNVTYSNILHGIVLYQRSNNNIVEGNTSYQNGLQGININDSSHNIARNNTVYENHKEGIGIGRDAMANDILNNEVYDNRHDGIALYSDARQNTVRSNTVYGNKRYGIYIKSEGNHVSDNTAYNNHDDNIREGRSQRVRHGE